MTDASPDVLAEAGATMARLVAGVQDAQWSAATPCPEWTVAELVTHVLAGNRLNAALLRGDKRPAGTPAPLPVAELPAAFDRSMAELEEAFGRPGALERTVPLPVGSVPGAVALDLRITELLVHGWDLARATGQELTVPEAATRRAWEFSRDFVHRIPPDREPFAASRSVPDDAPQIDRLVALLGRDVSRAS
jgi:uncharacterized protein (TIGR03086 family)